MPAPASTPFPSTNPPNASDSIPIPSPSQGSLRAPSISAITPTETVARPATLPTAFASCRARPKLVQEKTVHAESWANLTSPQPVTGHSEMGPGETSTSASANTAVAASAREQEYHAALAETSSILLKKAQEVEDDAVEPRNQPDRVDEVLELDPRTGQFIRRRPSDFDPSPDTPSNADERADASPGPSAWISARARAAESVGAWVEGAKEALVTGSPQPLADDSPSLESADLTPGLAPSGVPTSGPLRAELHPSGGTLAGLTAGEIDTLAPNSDPGNHPLANPSGPIAALAKTEPLTNDQSRTPRVHPVTTHPSRLRHERSQATLRSPIATSARSGISARGQSPHPSASPSPPAATSHDPSVLPTLSYLTLLRQPAFVVTAEPLIEAVIGRIAVSKDISPEDDDDDEAEVTVIERLENTRDNAGRFPYVSGREADRGQRQTMGELFLPVWSNRAYDEFMTRSSKLRRPSGDVQPCLLDLLDLSSARDLIKYVGDIVDANINNLVTNAGPFISLRPTSLISPIKSIDLSATLISPPDPSLSSTSPYFIFTCTVHDGSAPLVRPPHAFLQRTSSQTSGSTDTAVVSRSKDIPTVTGLAGSRPSLHAISTSSSSASSTVHDDDPRVTLRDQQQFISRWDDAHPSPPAQSNVGISGFVVERKARVKEARGWELEKRRTSRLHLDAHERGIGGSHAGSSLNPQNRMKKVEEAMETDQVDDSPPRLAESPPQEPSIPPEIYTSDPFFALLSRSQMGRRTITYPWHETPLGPIHSWSPALKSYTCHMLASKFRTALWWGEECVLLYNDEYIKSCGAKHPGLFGKSGGEAWAELWDAIGPLAHAVLTNAETAIRYDHLLFMDRNTDDPTGLRREETYHTWSYIPCFEDDVAKGFINFVLETTSRVIAERRLATLRNLVQMTSIAKTAVEYCEAVMKGLAYNPYDLTFAILYTVDSRQAKINPTNMPVGAANDPCYELKLFDTIGVPAGHTSAPERVEIKTRQAGKARPVSSVGSASSSTASGSTASLKHLGDDSLAWPLHEACLSGKSVYIPNVGSRADGFESRGWEDPVRSAVVIPVANEEQVPTAVLIVGLNPRRPWNEQYAIFLQLLGRQLATGITTVKGYEDQVKKAEELAALDRTKTAFFSNISHELRTPLTLILGPLEDVLNNRDVPASSKEHLKVVSRHAQRLLNLVNSLLDFSRLEAGRLLAHFKPIRLGPYTADLASLFRSAVERGHIQYQVDCGEADTVVWLDPDLWEKIVFNLIGNSFKYTLAGKISVYVRFSDRDVFFSVTDTGCGIAEDQLDMIFERFHRVEATGRSHEGTGIGLALTLELVKLLGGTLSVQSRIGKDSGSTFTVKLPLGNTHLPRDRIDESATIDEAQAKPSYGLAVVKEAQFWALDRTESSDSVSSAPSSGGTSNDGFQLELDSSHRGKTILLADDNYDMRRYCRSILAPLHARIVEVSNGKAALDFARQHPDKCDLVVSDIMMPIMDGITLLKSLRSDPTTQLMSVILVSARAGSEARADGLMQGADDYLVKPFQAKELLARVHTQLQFSSYRRELEARATERTKALIESEVRYRSLANRYHVVTMLGPVGVFALDGAGKILFANPKWYDISGHATDDPLDDWLDNIHDDDRARDKATWLTCLHEKRPWMTELRWKKTGNWCQIEVRPYLDPESGHTGFVGSITDISARKRIEELHIMAVEQRAQDAEEMRRQQEQFIDMTSHEMRNPLSGIWQNAEMIGSSLERIHELVNTLRSGKLPAQNSIDDLAQELEQDEDSVDSILLCAAHQRRIADDILNASKLSMGLISLSKSAFDITAKLASTLQMFRLEATQAQVSLKLHVCDGIEELGIESIKADPNRIGQVCVNFVTNALKFTSSETRKRSVTVHLDAKPQLPEPGPTVMRVLNPSDVPNEPDQVWIIIAVEDTGRGLDKAEQLRLFERFSQAHPKTDGTTGSGLGLFVSKQLVQLHNGFIELQSVRGKGSTFRFGFPASKMDSSAPDHGFSTSSARRILTRAVHSNGSAKTVTITNTVPRPNPHVLVVEDNFINQKVLRKQLEQHKFQVTVANNGQEALDQLFVANNTFDIVLMDIEMPVKNGLEAVKELRAFEHQHSWRHMPCIAVTGNARSEQVDLCLSHGFDSCVTKPYRILGLLEQIDQACAGK